MTETHRFTLICHIDCEIQQPEFNPHTVIEDILSYLNQNHQNRMTPESTTDPGSLHQMIRTQIQSEIPSNAVSQVNVKFKAMHQPKGTKQIISELERTAPQREAELERLDKGNNDSEQFIFTKDGMVSCPKCKKFGAVEDDFVEKHLYYGCDSMKDPKILLQMKYSGPFDFIDVTLTYDRLDYSSHEEGKASGYHFSMVREGDMYVVEKDETSHPVQGSDVLWLVASGYSKWSDAAKGAGVKESEAGISVSGGISVYQMQDAVLKMAKEDADTLDLRNI